MCYGFSVVQEEYVYQNGCYVDKLHRTGQVLGRGKTVTSCQEYVGRVVSSDLFWKTVRSIHPSNRLDLLEQVSNLLGRINHIDEEDLQYWRLWFDPSEDEIVLEVTLHDGSECYSVYYDGPPTGTSNWSTS